MPHEFVADAENRYAYVDHYGVPNSKMPGDHGRSVFVVDIALGAIAHTFALGEHARPHDIPLDAAGRLYVLSEQTETLLFWENPRDFGPFDHARPVGGKCASLCAQVRRPASWRRPFLRNLNGVCGVSAGGDRFRGRKAVPFRWQSASG